MKFDFNNPEHRKEKLRRIKARCTEFPPPRGKDLADTCWIPHPKIDDLVPVNEYVRGKLLGQPRGLHEITQMLASGRLRSASDDGLEVLHRCNRKACCNPTHLELGTRKQNNDAAIADGLFDPKNQTGKPKPSIQGEGNARAKASNRQAAEAKYLFSHPEEWYVREISAHHSITEAVAIHLHLSEPSLKRLQRRENWKALAPVRPETFPSIETVPADAEPPRPKKDGPIGPENAALILRGFGPADDKSGYITMWTEKLGVSRISIQNVLIGKTWREVEPGIRRETDFSSHRQKLTERAVQQIRATFAANPTVHGLQAALARKFRTQSYYIGFIIRRLARLDVSDDPKAIIPLEELEFKPSAQRGEAHKLCRLSDVQVWQILERHAAGESSAKLGVEFIVSYVSIYNVVKGKTRKDIWDRFHGERREREQGDEKGGK